MRLAPWEGETIEAVDDVYLAEQAKRIEAEIEAAKNK